MGLLVCGGEVPCVCLIWKFTRKILIPTSTKPTEPNVISDIRKNAFTYYFTQLVLYSATDFFNPTKHLWTRVSPRSAYYPKSIFTVAGCPRIYLSQINTIRRRDEFCAVTK